MKKLLILNGSPRKKGNTAVLSEHLKNNLSNDINAEQLFLYDYALNPCTDCRACKIDDLKCILDDGMTELYEKIDKADFIIIGTPIYWFGPSAQTKLMLDRFRPYYVNKKLEGKKAALILPAGTGAPDCDLTIEMFKRSFKALGVEFIGNVTSESYDVGDAYNDKDALQNIEKLAKLINL
ncbi:flavodoxin family protein [Bacteroidota bacterium]